MSTSFPLSHIIPVTNLTEPLPINTLFDPARPLEIEIGCGKGRFLSARAAQNPATQYLGIERMLSRVAKLDKKAVYERHGLKLLEIGPDDLARLDEVLPRKLLKHGLAVY